MQTLTPLHPIRTLEDLARNGLQELTHSRMQTRKNCPMRDYYRNELLLVPRHRSTSLSIGSAVHKGLETGRIEAALTLFDETYPTTQDEADKLEQDRASVDAMLSGAFNYFRPLDGATPEIRFQVPIINPDTGSRSRSFVLGGKADGLWFDGRWWLIEYKTASQIDRVYVDRLSLDTQITTYIYALQQFYGIPIAGVIYRTIRKPTIRQRKNETIFEFADRIQQDYLDRPEFYFHEFMLYRSQDDINSFELELWLFTQRLLQDQRMNLHFKNTSKCSDYGGCPYIPLCSKQQDAEALYEVGELNPELKEVVQHGVGVA